jgi:hypothetical protein
MLEMNDNGYFCYDFAYSAKTIHYENGSECQKQWL